MASNLRALVSNIDGSWGHWDYSQASSGPPPVDGVLNTDNALTAAGSIYFPPGASKGTKPVESEMFFSTELSGWTSKSNWMIQLDGTFNSQNVSVFVGRPTGIEEEIITAAPRNITWGGGSSIDLSGSAAEIYENIVGPVTYFRFVANGAVTSVKCYVIAWNEGDICDAVGKLS